MDTPQLMSRSKKLKIIASATIIELKNLRKEMSEHNNNLQAVVLLSQQGYHSPGESAAECLRTARLTRENKIQRGALKSNDAQSVSIQVSERTRDSSELATINLRTVQVASRKLHGIVCKALRISCRCHLLHLCLDSMAIATNNQSGSAAKPKAQFLFLLSHSGSNNCEHGLPTTDRPIPYLHFTCHDPDSAGALLGEFEHGEPDAVYQELLALDEQFVKHFRIPNAPTDDIASFTLRRACSLKALDPSPVVSLDQLISCSRGKLEPLGCCQIAANLTKSVLSFYASPWIRDWTLETIQCYDKSVNPFQELWVPHVPVKFSSGIGARNREIHALGLILLQLGRKQRLDSNNLDGEDEDVILEKALNDLHTKMGTAYRELVEKCIWTWGQGNLDLMEEENLKEFLSDIEELEKLIVNYTPRYVHISFMYTSVPT